MFLSHHGIKGQRWGVKNGPPYPLKAKDHSKSEQSAGWRSSLKGSSKSKSSVKKHGLSKKQRRAI